MDKKDSLSVSLIASLQTPALKDTAVDFAEVTLDNLQDLIHDNPLFRELPLVKSVLSIAEIGIGISKYFSIKKLLAFIQTLQNGKPAEEEIQKRVVAIKNGEKWVQKEAEFTLVYLEEHTQIEKAQIQALLYRDLVNQTVSFEEYSEELEILDRLFAQDICQLIKIFQYEEQSHEAINTFGTGKLIMISYVLENCQRLEAIGLLYHYTENGKTKRHLTKHGKHIAAICVELSLYE